jgi:hypothetical protein
MHTPIGINYVQCAEGDKRPQQPCEQHAYFLKANGSRFTAKTMSASRSQISAWYRAFLGAAQVP